MAEAELNLLTGATDGWQKTLAQGMLELPLPPDWKKKQGYKGRPYYFHRLTGDTSSSHPQLTLFKSIMEEVTSWPPDGAPQELARRSERHLRTAHVAALKVLSQWSGPHCMEGGSRPDRPLPVDVRDVYFYNCSTRETSWVDPRGPLQFDLQQRQELLNTAMALFPLPRPSDSCDKANDEGAGHDDLSAPEIQVIPPNERTPLTLPVPARGTLLGLSPETSPARRLSPRRGDDSCCSQRSFYSAVSTCSDEASAPEHVFFPGRTSLVVSAC